ncbi:hypothetical protein ACMXYQ_12400 [Neptuniibacter sp. PT34_22]|uniref:hypothetical protein n=1 Tax=Neptuniibacter sp. PT34_22 TaxID=3398205 RepID=UPI0039F6105C
MTSKNNDLNNELYWVPDREMWIEFSNNKDRKDLWKAVNPTIKRFFKDHYSKAQFLNLHKQLFFKGEVPEYYRRDMASRLYCNGDEEFCFEFFYFYMWYHPSLTDEIVDGVLQKIIGTGLDQLERLRDVWGLHYKISGYCKSLDRLGMMNGNEKILVKKILFFKLRDGSTFINKLPYRRLFEMMVVSACVLKGPDNNGKYIGNPQDITIFLWGDISKAVAVNNPDININPHKYKIRTFFYRTIKDILNPSPNLPEDIKEMCIFLRKQWVDGDFEPWLSQLFDKVAAKLD